MRPISWAFRTRLLVKFSLFFILVFSRPGNSASYLVKMTDRGMRAKSKISYSAKTLFKSENPEITFRPALRKKRDSIQLNKWFLVESQTETDAFLKLLSDSGYVDYTQPLGYFKITSQESDSLVEKQWYLSILEVENAWAVTKGNGDVVVGIIDTGIDYEHPDLINNIWINPGEDTNANGRFDPTDLNGIDDDANGFTDDIMGWDFTDAPRFADAGDYQEPDYNPMDEFPSGHGTQIAGIIAAEHNDLGINGIAPKVKLMNLRAGTASGYLEEDDVARSLLYAIEHGARIINMSFGDVALSQFLKDVIRYAYEQGAIIIASAGNDATNQVHYPSGLPEVISIGASNEADNRASFSNFGSTIDLVAPGVSILSTGSEGSYSFVNGTSFSTPFASAAAALLLSVWPNYSAEQIRNILKTSSKDIIESGWDQWTGSGRLSVGDALRVREAGELSISQPFLGFSTANDQLAIIGTVVHPDIESFELNYGIGINPLTWQLLRSESGRQVVEDTLAILNLGDLPDTTLTLSLRMNLLHNLQDELRVQFDIDRSLPTIENPTVRPLLDGSYSSSLISFTSDDITSAGLFLKKKGEGAFDDYVASGYTTNNHRIKLDQSEWEGEFEFFIENKNASGLVSLDSNNNDFYQFANSNPIVWEDFFKVSWTLPAGYLLGQATDLDHDSKKEIIMSRYNEKGGFGPIEIYEFENGQFELRLKTGFTAIPRAAGDVDQDGLSDLLLGYGQQSYLLESTADNIFPEEVIWQDTVQYWAAAYLDADEDGMKELIGRVDSQYVILEATDDNYFEEIARLGNPSDGENRYGVPKIVEGDFNGDGRLDISFGDLDGDFFVFTSVADNTFILLAEGKAELSDATEMLTMDSRGHLFVGTHTSENLNYEHEFDARYWAVQGFQYSGNQQLPEITMEKSIYGYFPTRDYDSGMKLAELDDLNVLFVSFFPNLYLFKKHEDYWIPFWHYQEARSNTVIVTDFDNDGNDEFYFNDGSQIVGFSRDISYRPSSPRQLTAIPLDSTRISLSWTGNSPVYKIYRKEGSGEFQTVGEIKQPFFMDSPLQPDQNYYYSVTAVDSGFSIPESYFSPVDSAFTSYPPKVERIKFSNIHQLILSFNEPVRVVKPGIIRLSDTEKANSVIELDNQTQVLVSFEKPFYSGLEDTLYVTGITDHFGVNVDLRFNSKKFIYEEQGTTPYLEGVEILDRNHLQLFFNTAMDPVSLTDTENYTLEPSGRIIQAVIRDSAFKTIELELDESSFVGGFGQSSYLILGKLKSRVGVEISGTIRIHLYEEVDDLSKMIVYPQPLKPNQNEIIFARLPDNVEIAVYGINGKLVKNLTEKTFFGGIKWNLLDNNESGIPSGIYIYEARLKGKKRLGKLVIIR